MRLSFAIRLALVLVLLALGGCGGDDEGGDSPAPDGGSAQEGARDGGGSAGAPEGEVTTAAEEGSPAGGGGDSARPGIYMGMQRGVATGYIAFGVPQSLPSRLEIGGDATVVGVRWAGWGGRSATGTGSLRVNTCVPTCADGKIERRPGARAVVSDLREGDCRGEPARFYTSATVRFPAGLGLPARRIVSLFARCGEEG